MTHPVFAQTTDPELSDLLMFYRVGLSDRAATLAPHVNNNGESGTELSRRHYTALDLTRAAYAAVAALSPNGRDHQTQPDPKASLRESVELHRLMLSLLHTATTALEGLVEGLADQGYYNGRVV